VTNLLSGLYFFFGCLQTIVIIVAGMAAVARGWRHSDLKSSGKELSADAAAYLI